ncbi:DNA repair protein RecN [Pedomonas mirosovicensis]|uniref:DNA repair protein RecN n=1 Tax=Pedomonas mirosovicensis TaxID=2908641 RepID=UPI002168CFA4|nr:DNA repair protein RecN [Pedomonas mirosovicensis]MCH8684821.1 DNA repair protein RecN [Pedomonas mirosovicensis]
MLTSLTIRDVVLIEALTIEFEAGLCVLTGETGAGKSILLDSLGLALGARAESSMVRRGSTQASVTAAFELPADHPARQMVREAGLEDGEPLLLRRIVKADGGSRAYINDQPVGVSLLREVGGLLVEIHGQHDERGLLNPRGHRDLLDAFGQYDDALAASAGSHAAWVAARDALERARASLAEAERDREWLTHAVDELQRLKPEPGEEQTLADERATMMKGQRLAGDLDQVLECIGNSEGGLPKLRHAARKLERLAAEDEALAKALEALDRAVNDASEAEDTLIRARHAMDYDPARVEAVETRLFDLRAMARKHKVAVDDLAALTGELSARLATLEAGEVGLAKLEAEERQAWKRFAEACERLHQLRVKAAAALDAAMAAELPPLKLEAAKFKTMVETLPESGWGAGGSDRVEFTISTNPSAPFGPLMKIASGGEMSRFILALKVALAGEGVAGTLVFDEIDRGVGGSVASAIGDRLSRLGRETQVLVVTHSPQVAASADCQWQIAKAANEDGMRTSVHRLSQVERREEIARMLSGDIVTDEARAQAQRLLKA